MYAKSKTLVQHGQSSAGMSFYILSLTIPAPQTLSILNIISMSFY
jgi:hypothetical protein